MICYLHIGTEKTGSTSLQNFLALNRSCLLKQGLVYTKSLGWKNNKALCYFAFPVDRRNDMTMELGVRKNNELLKRQLLLKSRLQRELCRIRKKHTVKKVVFSSELIQSRVTQVNDLKRLRQFLLDTGFSDVKIVVYLREQAGIAQSLYSTAIKVGHAWKNVPKPDNEYFRNICDHKETIKRFQHVFGSNSVIPRIFEKEKMVGQSIISDFFDVIGEPLNADYQFENNANKSLSYTGIKLLHAINEMRGLPEESIEKFKNRDLVYFLEKNLSDSKFKISEKERSEYRDYFFDSNEWVRTNFFPNEESLFNTKKNESAQIKELEVDQVAKLIHVLWEEKYSLINKYQIRLLLKKLKIQATKIQDVMDYLIVMLNRIK